MNRATRPVGPPMHQPPMRILFVLESFPALSETFVLNQITGLIDRGHTIDILAGPPLHQTQAHPQVAAYRLMDRVTHWPAVPASLFARARIAARMTAARGVGGAGLLARTVNPLAMGLTGLALRPMYLAAAADPAAPAYDAILCHYGKIGRWCEIARAAGALRGPIITFFHAYDITRYVNRHGRGVYRRLMRRGELFLAISEHGRQTLLSLGAPPERTAIHHMGVDCRRFVFEPPVSRAAPEGALRLLSVARLTEKKGLAYAIEAVALLATGGRPVRYRIIGDGELRVDLQQLIRRRGLAAHVELLGWRGADEVRESMRHADVLLAPSVTADDGAQEGIPVVLMEAMADGLPVLSTRHAGIGELVKDGVSGMLVPERDAAALAQALESLAGDPARRQRLAIAARRTVEADFEIGVLNDRLAETCRTLASAAPPTNP